jgi:hypothetical protein
MPSKKKSKKASPKKKTAKKKASPKKAAASCAGVRKPPVFGVSEQEAERIAMCSPGSVISEGTEGKFNVTIP